MLNKLKVIIENPRFVRLNIQTPMGLFADKEQIIRIIEKMLMQKNILAEKITVE